MVKQNDSSRRKEPVDFNQFMFGRPPEENQSTIQKKEEDSFDIFDTTSTLYETYQQLSPYFGKIRNMIKRMK